MSAVLAIGIGCRKDCASDAIAALVRRALELALAAERMPSPARGRRCRSPWRRADEGDAKRNPPSSALTAFGLLLLQEGEGGGAPARLFTSQTKAAEAGPVAAAALLGIEFVGLPQAELERAAPRCATRSERVLRATGLPSLAECAALAGAGRGSRLILERISEGGASCAVALLEEHPS